MQRKEPKTTAGMVCAILHREFGLFYSITEIKEMIYDEYYCRINHYTIRDAIAELNGAMPIISSKIERRGANKQPITIFSIDKQF